RPTLLVIDGVIREVLEQCKGGLFVPPGDDQALADAILRLKANPEEACAMGRRAREYVVANFNRADQAHQFSLLIENIAGQWSRERSQFYRRIGKRCLDLAFVVPAIVLISPLLLLLAGM